MFGPLTIEVVFAIRTRHVKVILNAIRIRYLIATESYHDLISDAAYPIKLSIRNLSVCRDVARF